MVTIEINDSALKVHAMEYGKEYQEAALFQKTLAGEKKAEIIKQEGEQ